MTTCPLQESLKLQFDINADRAAAMTSRRADLHEVPNAPNAGLCANLPPKELQNWNVLSVASGEAFITVLLNTDRYFRCSFRGSPMRDLVAMGSPSRSDAVAKHVGLLAILKLPPEATLALDLFQHSTTTDELLSSLLLYDHNQSTCGLHFQGAFAIGMSYIPSSSGSAVISLDHVSVIPSGQPVQTCLDRVGERQEWQDGQEERALHAGDDR